jgi:DNA-binding transcriptional MerR regulator
MTQRKIEVDMSSNAIDARLREVAQLRNLGLSIAKAKPIAPLEPTTEKAPVAASQPARCEPDSEVRGKASS